MRGRDLPGRGQYLKAAIEVLTTSGEPLHYRELTARALREGLFQTNGTTPWATMNAQLSVAIRRLGAECPFVRVQPGVFGLRRWVDDGSISAVHEPSEHAYGPSLPMYDRTRAVLSAWVGATSSQILEMRAAIRALHGTRRTLSTGPTRTVGSRAV